MSDADKVVSIVNARNDRKTKLIAIVEKVLGKRDQILLKAQPFYDVFKNLNENAGVETDIEESFEEVIQEFRNEIEKLQD